MIDFKTAECPIVSVASFFWKMAKSSHSYHAAVLFLTCCICLQACAENLQCKGVQSISGMMLRGHVFQEHNAASIFACSLLCNSNIRCQSINYVRSRHLCELNNRTKDPRPEDYVQDDYRVYLTRPSERVSLGSLQEVPAASCKEIKASEGTGAVSGNYWLDSIKADLAVLVPCDMGTGDADECNASVRICDENAICQNTLGSFFCTCKSGFSGKGFTCVDIDECVSGTHNCISGKAICKNTLGSYKCTCQSGYRGDGRNYCILDECQNYQVLNSADRKVTNDNTPLLCDSTLGPAWFRFHGEAGTKMPTLCVPTHRCGTDATGWLNGAHPEEHEGKVTRQVCFSWDSNCCFFSVNIQVQNCSGYYLYYINGTYPENPCYLRFCSTD
ncbi:uromodulin-like isoform X2 [Acropora millepora]|uniref:uromodulin-like isoform X1 n=2 Tax=Acropora millepora TaxID=45264 RepID=UPI001CF27646|nr:uromodulin-like isoform X1 [Acropora millepora]XP_029182789.2 uromodulin-like isoform X2 [Acropora millepora]